MITQIEIPDQTRSKTKSPKAQKISDTLTQTRLRRKSQVCKTFTVKVDKSHTSKKAHDHLFMMFLEKKWIYNYLVTLPREIDLFKFDYKTLTEVPIRVGDHFDSRSITHLPAQIKQSVVDDVQNSIKSLATLKKRGFKIGSLKPRSHIGSITLSQYLNTWYITATGRHVKIAGIKKHLRVSGLDQIPEDAELTSARLILKHRDFFLKINCYLPRPSKSKSQTQTLQKLEQPPKLELKIDFGIKTPLTLGIDENNCINVIYRIRPSKRLRRLSRSLSSHQPRTNKKKKVKKKAKSRPSKKHFTKSIKKKRNKKKIKKVKRSHNYWKTQNALRKEYEHIKNIKKNIINQIVHDLNKCSATVTCQKDNIVAWKSSKMRGWGLKLHDTNLGGLRRILRERIQALREVDTFFASTQTCFKCGHRQKMPLHKRIYVCCNPECNWVCDRDHNAALNIGQEGDRLESKELSVPREPRELTSGETRTSTLNLLVCLNNIPQVEASLVVEPQKLLAELDGLKRSYISVSGSSQ